MKRYLSNVVEMKRIKNTIRLIAIVAMLSATMVDAAFSKTASNVPTSKADAVDATGQVCTAAPFFVDMPSMSKTFTFGGTTSRRVIVLFQGEFGLFAEGSAAAIQLMIDGILQSGPGNLFVDHHHNGEPNQAGTHGFNFISDPLAPGTHTVKIQWRDNGAGPACVFARSLIILHQ